MKEKLEELDYIQNQIDDKLSKINDLEEQIRIINRKIGNLKARKNDIYKTFTDEELDAFNMSHYDKQLIKCSDGTILTHLGSMRHNGYSRRGYLEKRG